MQATALCASVLGLLLLTLSVRTIMLRRAINVGIGDGGDARLQRAMRVQANFSEYVPLTLILLALLELRIGSGWQALGLGACLVAGRLIHAVGVSQVDEPLLLRVIGMVLTFGALAGASIGLMLVHLT